VTLLLLLAALPQQGFSLLREGRYRQAIEAFHEELEERPNHPPLEIGLARAYASSGRCGLALPLFHRNRPDPTWLAVAGREAATCHARRGEFSEAIYLLEEAWLMAPEKADVWHDLHWWALQIGDSDLLDRSQQQVQDSAMATAREAFYAGDHDAFFLAIREVQRNEDTVRADALEARVWLQLDDPQQAVRVLLPDETNMDRALRPSIAPWLTEARRRCGDTDRAQTLASLRRHGPEAALIMQAMRLRVRADLGEDVQAEALDLYTEHPFDAEVVATAWYVTGDEHFAERFELVHGSAAKRLDVLLPISRR